MANKKPTIAFRDINIKQVMIGVSVLGNVVLVVLVVAFLSGMLNYFMLYNSIDKMTDDDGCFLAQDRTVPQDSKGRVLMGDDSNALYCIVEAKPDSIKQEDDQAEGSVAPAESPADESPETF